MTDTERELQDVFRDVFGDDSLELTPDTTALDVPGWDSLGHLNLVVAIEQRFGITMANGEISRLKDEGQNIGTLVKLIDQKKSGVR